jgi:4-hydroxy-4-methyl-2-oxoglutarate aldolase
MTTYNVFCFDHSGYMACNSLAKETRHMFDIRPLPPALPPALLERAMQVQPATVGHFRFRGLVDGAIRPITNHGRVCGTAVTIALPGMDSTLLHHAAGLLRPGDVLVIDRLGDNRHACLGGGVAIALGRMGVRAVVVDGPCADPDEIKDSGLAVWARGVSPTTTRLLGIGGALNVPVSVGGAVVMPGDLVIADDGGVLILPPAEATEAIERAIRFQHEQQQALTLVGPLKPLGELSGATAMVRAKQASAGG